MRLRAAAAARIPRAAGTGAAGAAAGTSAAGTAAAGTGASGAGARRTGASGTGPVARHDDTVEGAFAAAVADPGRLGGLLDALRLGRLWLPLAGEERPVTEGGGVRLPTVRYLGGSFIPAYTSAARLRHAAENPGLAWAGTGPAPAADAPDGPGAPDVPHAVVRAADLARLLPPGIGIAVNPGCPESVPVFPAGVAAIAAAGGTAGGGRRGAAAVLPAPRRPSA